MTEPLAAGRPDFFGKDSFTPFIGQVEDVNDPTHSGRVKVRCVGWHPMERNAAGGQDDALSTDDLPWARVGMPTTHAQQSRIGGKHGLLPGCWVMGFFLDGEEAQDPFILTTFNFTAKASQKDNNKNTAGKKGKLEDSAKGLDNKLVSDATQPNTGLKTAKEQGGGKQFSDDNDPAGATVANDSDSACGGPKALQSAAEKAAQDKYTKDNPGGQEFNETSGDGNCGSTAHATEDIRLKLQEQMPSQLSRFNYGDIVWEKFQGNYVDLNGVLAQLSLDICALLKQLVMSIKSEQEERNREAEAASIPTTPGRNPRQRERLAEQQERQSDLFHAIMAQFIDQLCSLIMGLLQQQNNGGSGGDVIYSNISVNSNVRVYE